jgi:hypothetical protein
MAVRPTRHGFPSIAGNVAKGINNAMMASMISSRRSVFCSVIKPNICSAPEFGYCLMIK